MKQVYRNILLLFLATIVFFVGAGITIVDLCCTNCIENIISMKSRSTACDVAQVDVKSHSCCSSETSVQKDVSPCMSEHEGKCCEAERISVDIDHRVSNDTGNNAAVWSFIHCYCCCFCHTPNTAGNSLSIDYPDEVPIPPRDYLSLIRVLII